MVAHYQFTGSTAAEIVASVEVGVRTGELPAGVALPAVRALAADLGVSPATVAKAYQSLRQRGVVATAGRNGTRIRPRPPVAGPRGAARPAVPPGLLDLSAGEPDPRLLPRIGSLLAAVAAETTTSGGYRAAGVLPELADLATARLAADGVPVGGLAVTSGALDGIERLLGAHLRPGDPVALEDPGWANLFDLVAALGLRPVPMAVDSAGPTPAALRAALAAGARAVIATAREQNPTGVAVTADRAGALRKILAAHPDVLLIEDDHAAELAGVPLHPLVGATPTWGFIRSMSKPYGPDLRLAVVAGDEATVARVAGRMRAGVGWVSTLLQRLTVRLWRDPEVTRAVAEAGRAYARRVAALRAALAERDVPMYPSSGINVWVPVPDETRAVTALRDAGYAVAPGALFRLASPPGIRITVSPLDLDDDGPGGIEPLAAAVAEAVRPTGPATFTA